MMSTDRQRFGDFLSAAGAYLTGVVRSNFNHCPTSFCRFVGQEIKEHAPARIRNAFGKVSVTHHALDIQVFHIDSLILPYVEVRCFVQKIFSLIADLFVRLGNQYAGLLSLVRAFLLPSKAALPTPQQLFRLYEISRWLNPITVRVNTERFEPHVYANFGSCFGQHPLRHVVGGKGDEPLAGSTPADSDSLDVSINRAGEEQLESADVFDVEVSALKYPSSLLESERIITVPAPKPGEPGLAVAWTYSLKKSFVRFVETLNHVLKALRANYLEFRERFFKFRQLSHLGNCGHGYPVLSVDADSLFEGKVVERPAEIKPLFAGGFSLVVYLCLIKIGLSHLYRLLILNVLFDNRQRCSANSYHTITVGPEGWYPGSKRFELSPQYSGSEALNIFHQAVYAELRVHFNQKVHMVGHHFHLDKIGFKLLNLLLDKFLKPFIDCINKHGSLVFGTPYHMILTGINHVVVRFKLFTLRHTDVIRDVAI